MLEYIASTSPKKFSMSFHFFYCYFQKINIYTFTSSHKHTKTGKTKVVKKEFDTQKFYYHYLFHTFFTSKMTCIFLLLVGTLNDVLLCTFLLTKKKKIMTPHHYITSNTKRTIHILCNFRECHLIARSPRQSHHSLSCIVKDHTIKFSKHTHTILIYIYILIIMMMMMKNEIKWCKLQNESSYMLNIS